MRLIPYTFIALLLCLAMPLHAEDAAPPTEADHIAVIESDAEWEAKYEACYALRQIGTDAAVPALAELLDEEHLSHMARYALQSIGSDAAKAAMRDALPEVEDAHKIGLLATLAALRDREAAPGIVELSQSSDGAVKVAAINALGRIGGPGTLKALREGAKSAEGDMKMAYGEALLDLAAKMRRPKDAPPKLRIGLYRQLMGDDWPEPVRYGAFRGLAHLVPREAPALIGEAMASEDAKLRDFAAQLVAEVGGPALTRRLAALLQEAPVEGQLALLRGLADRGDPNARRMVKRVYRRGEPEVRLAAIQTLGSIGTAEDVSSLASNLFVVGGGFSDYARKSLIVLQAEGVDEAIEQEYRDTVMSIGGDLLEILAERGAPQALPLALEALDSIETEERVAALGTVAQLGTADHADEAIALLDTGDEDVDEAAAKALARISSREGNAALATVTAALEGDPATTPTLLKNLGRIGSAEALAVLLPRLDSGYATDAVAVLADWPGQEARPHLLALAEAGGDAREQAFAGFVRLAREEPDAGAKTAALKKAGELAESKQERWQVISAWATLPTAESFDILLAQVDDDEVNNEAASAVLNIAKDLANNAELKPRVLEALATFADKDLGRSVKERAARILGELQ